MPNISTEQLNLAIADPADRLIGQHLIGMVNEAGYLTGDVASGGRDCSAPTPTMSSACSTILQGFDPPGVFARDLKECLALQLKERDRYDPAMATLVDQSRTRGQARLRRPQDRCARSISTTSAT